MKYGDVRLADELQFSVYNFEAADVEKAWKHFELYEAECKVLLQEYAALTRDQRPRPVSPKDAETRTGHPRFPVLGAYDLYLKYSHLFNILNTHNAISMTERVGVIARVRALAVGIAKAWVDQQNSAAPEELDHPVAIVESKRKAEKLQPV